MDSIPNSVSTLEDLSVIATASHLCNLLNVKKKIQDFFDEPEPAWRLQHTELLQGLYFSKLLNDLSDIFLDELKRQNLPEALKPKVLDKSLEIAERIYDWILHLICDFKLERKYAEEVYLTSHGEIDVDEIFKSHWMNFSLEIGTIQYLACMFFQEEYVVKNQTEIFDEILYIIPLEFNDDIVFAIMKFLTCVKAKEWRKTDHTVAIATKFLLLSNLKLLDICLSLGLYKPFIYFWNHLKESEKSIYLNYRSENSVGLYLKCNLKADYVAENLFKIIIFLTDKMSFFQIDDFILCFFHNFRSIFRDKRKCLKKFCIRFVDKFLPILSNNFGDEKFFLEDVFYLFDISLFKCVINHEIYKKRKGYVLDFGKKKYKELISICNFRFLNELIDVSLKTENEKNHFKMKYNFLRDWISEEKWDEVNNVLEWMRTLSKIDKRNIILEQLKYSLGEKLTQKLLKWFAGTDNEPLINNCEDRSSVTDLTREIIYKLWLQTSKTFSQVHICSEILQCVFGTENEIINFKKNVLAKDEIAVVRFFCQTKLETKEESRANFSIMEEFLKFCLVEEKIEKLNKSIAEDVDDLIK